ncbi:MAG: TIGR03960 family B12-binding radical SAM protein [Candidatus Brocadiae bacterium]|nr:TIGR03960 family B12-binding radical SAM protein [Candidatus Brocadiia bacterium]
MSLWPSIEPLLLNVQAPAQYTGGEVNSIRKATGSVRARVALAFPDTYKIGMSHLGLAILYGLLNREPDLAAERVFAPWTDMEERMRAAGVPLYSLESKSPVREFDVLGFSLQYELSFTNVVNMLDLAGIPLRSRDRGRRDPLVIAGGSCAFQPEPIAEFIDVFVLGDGEDRMLDIARAAADLRGRFDDRADYVRELVRRIPNLYAPLLYDAEWNPDGSFASLHPNCPEAPLFVQRAQVADFEQSFFPTRPVVPAVECVHERINLEIMRGCPHACRFCQAGMIKLPVRARSVETLVRYAQETYAATGYDEIALTSLSTADYPHLEELMMRLKEVFDSRRVGLSLPSLRVNERIRSIPGILNTIRKAGFTMAPEAGTERMRKVIHKLIRDEDLYAAATAAYREGWDVIKVYYMIGLPHETDTDIDATCEAILRTSRCARETTGRDGELNVTVSPFVPKAHTPFQWDAMASPDRFRAIRRRMHDRIRSRKIHLKVHDPERAYVEGIISRGDRRLGPVIERAVKSGLTFDAWDERFDYGRWMALFAASGIDPARHNFRERDENEPFGWDHLDGGPPRRTLLRSRVKAGKLAEAYAV